jgi:hypothetical protein
MQNLTKLKLIINPKLTCTQIPKSLKKVGWKKMIHVSQVNNENTNLKMKSKVLKQLCPPNLVLIISKYNSHN